MNDELHFELWEAQIRDESPNMYRRNRINIAIMAEAEQTGQNITVRDDYPADWPTDPS
jgi:hypothetical protein